MSGTPTEISVDSIGGLGDGIARLNNIPVFIPKSCAGDRLLVSFTQKTKDFIRARIVKVLVAGPERVAPACPHYEACGGCSMQHVSENAYHNFKRGVLANALTHAGFGAMPAEMVFLPAASRRRVEFSILHTVDGVSLAFHGLRSHERVGISQCPVLTPALAALIAPLTQRLNALPCANRLTSASLTVADNGIDLLLSLEGPDNKTDWRALGHALGLIRISITDGKRTRPVHETATPHMTLGGTQVRLPADAFLQAASEGQRLLGEFALRHTAGARQVADLFCGIGSYALPVSKSAKVHAVELQGEAVQALQQAIDANGLNQRLSTTARDLFKNPLSAQELARYDAVIVNPPRAGAKAQTEEIARSNVNRVVMISCNPASFARDAKTLKEAGFTLQDAFGLDQFVWSPHLEIAAYFSR